MAKPKQDGQGNGGGQPQTPQGETGAPTAAPPVKQDLLARIRESVNKLSPEQVKAQLEKMKAQQAKQREKRTGKALTPEQLAKRKEYNKARMSKPEVKEKMKAYRQRPETKEKMKAYRQSRAAKMKELMARAQELGIDLNTPAAPTA